jgi:hypothetical protein
MGIVIQMVLKCGMGTIQMDPELYFKD